MTRASADRVISLRNGSLFFVNYSTNARKTVVIVMNLAGRPLWPRAIAESDAESMATRFA